MKKTQLIGDIAQMVEIPIAGLETQKAALCGAALNDRIVGSVKLVAGRRCYLYRTCIQQ